MPISVFMDGSGTHGGDLLTLGACVISDNQLVGFNSRWASMLSQMSLPALHMRELRTKEERTAHDILAAAFNVLGEFRTEFLYFATCTVMMDAYRLAKAEIPGLRSAVAM